MNKAPGIDSVGMRMLTELSEEIIDVITELNSKSLASGDVLHDW